MNEFKSYHPIVNFTYFVLVIGFSMFCIHPLSLIISLLCGFVYSVMLKGYTAIKSNILYMLPMMICAALINPAFNHEGVTILNYLPSGNPLTLESIAYGIAAAAMLASVICWFSCYNQIMTSDKFIYLFGRVIPSMSLLLSMTLRFVPRFSVQMKNIAAARRCIGKDASNGALISRAKHGLSILSVMTTRALENSIETADSMRSRGYGLKGRTAFSIFKFDDRDMKAFACILIFGIYTVIGALAGQMYFRYFPSMKSCGTSPLSISVFAAYFALCATPIAIEIVEEVRWKATK